MRRRRATVMTVTLALVAAAAAVMWPQQAGAAPYNPIPNVSWGTNGEARAAVLHGGTLYVGGEFSALRQGSSSSARLDLAAIDTATGSPVSAFSADTNGSVEALATDGSWLYVGGTFTTIKNVSRTNLARVNLTTGAVDPAFNLAPNSTVYDLWVHGDRLYVGGDFTSISGQTRQRVAAVNLLTTGTLVTNFAPSVNRRIWAVATSPDGSVVYVGGRFTSIGGTSFSYLAALDASNGSVLPIDFDHVEPPDPATMTSNVLDIDTTATQVVVALGGTHFNRVGVWGAAGQPDAGANRWRRGTDPGDKLDGDVQTVHFEAGIVYFGFHGGYNGNTGLRMMSASAANGDLDTFQPPTNGIRGVEDITSSGSLLVAVGDFSNSGGVPLDGVALFPAGSSGGTTTSSTTSRRPARRRPRPPPRLRRTPTTPPRRRRPLRRRRRPPRARSTTPPPGGTVNVSPSVETPNRAPAGTNDADDAAIWVHPTDPSKSLILGSVKQWGLDVYRPDGTVVQTLGAGGGRFNNVDLVYPNAASVQALAIVTDRKTDKLHIFTVNGDSQCHRWSR